MLFIASPANYLPFVNLQSGGDNGYCLGDINCLNGQTAVMEVTFKSFGTFFNVKIPENSPFAYSVGSIQDQVTGKQRYRVRLTPLDPAISKDVSEIVFEFVPANGEKVLVGSNGTVEVAVALERLGYFTGLVTVLPQ